VKGWQLGIDFGTSYTVTAVARNGSVSVVDVEVNGNMRLPSCVYLNEDGQILVGTKALAQAVFGPERFEPTPKRAIGEGEIFLGDRLIAVTELAAAVFRKVYTDACRQQGETVPDAVRVTHPADWGPSRLALLRDAVERAGIEGATLIAEPVAAAARIAMATPPGRHIAVYDFGGGTFDAAVLYRTPDSFVVAGPPAGRDPLGGEDIDQRIITYIGTVVGDASDAWLTLLNPGDTASRRNAASFRREVQQAKETLSEVQVCQLWIPGLERDLQLTKSELEELIKPDIEATVDTLETAIADAGVAVADLAGVYLVGGSSRIPLVESTIWRRLGVKPMVQDSPKSVVALGAAAWTETSDQVTYTPMTPPEPTAAAAPEPAVSAPADGLWRSYLAADVSSMAWAAGSDTSCQLVVDRRGQAGATIRARDEPTRATSSMELAAEVRKFRVARTPGYRDVAFNTAPVLGHPDGAERRFTMTTGGSTIVMVERYLVADGRAFVVAAPEVSLATADRFAIGAPPPAGVYWSRLEFPLERDLSTTEQLVVQRHGTSHSILVEHRAVPEPVTLEAWFSYSLGLLQQRLTGSAVVGRTRGRVLGNLEGDIVSLRSNVRGSPVLTKLGVAVAQNDVFAVTISLPHREQSQFASLARQVYPSPLAAVATPA
jgi:actin-like ATPase involved in cell morphogenesis